MVCNSRLTSLLFGGLLILSSNVYAEDDYLKMLESEASGLELDKSGQLTSPAASDEAGSDKASGHKVITKTDWKWEGELNGDLLPKGLAQDEFATLLEQHFYGTFVFFRKLDSNDQKTVYYHYKKSPQPDLDDVRQDILGLLKR